MPKLSIIIVNWNTSKLLSNLLKSLEIKNQKSKIKIEVIVVDNDSTDGSVEMVKRLMDRNSREFAKIRDHSRVIKLIENKENLGFAKANNQGIKEARGEYIMLLNSDTIVGEGTLQKLIEYLDKSRKIAVSPMLFYPDGRPQNDYYMRFPNLWQIFFYHNSVLRWVTIRIPFLRSLVVQRKSDRIFEVDQLPGAALMAHREVWDKVGLLDEDYHFLFEDVDWCWRAKKKAVRLIVVPEAKITHIGGASWKKRLKQDSCDFYYQFFSSMLLFVRKNYSEYSAKIFKWAIILNFILTFKPPLAWKFFKNDGQQQGYLVV